MKDQIVVKLNQIRNLDDRLLLKNVLNDVFLNLYEHSETMYRQLEERVFAEMAGLAESYDIYAAAAPRQEIDPVHYFLRPMLTADLAAREYDLANIMPAATSQSQYPLMKVFFDCDYRMLRSILNSGRIFRGAIVTDQGSIAAAFTLRPDLSYREQIASLYEAFINNNLPWKTINHPYIFRFAEVILQQWERVPGAEEVVREIKVDFAEYGPYVHYDTVPLWNVETLQLPGAGFPLPCEDKINFEHTISLEAAGPEHGYLAAVSGEQNIRYVRRTGQALTIVAPEQGRNTWDIIRIIKPAAGKIEKQKYPLVSNAKRQAFSDILAERSPRVIRTEAELRRLVATFVAAEDLSLSRLEIVRRGQAGPDPGERYEMNFFMMDEIRRADWQNRLLLYFTTTAQDYFLIYDLMSFIVAEVQLYYPDYQCEGILI
ncbi:Hypothetical protein LUCI_4310 [Lucifera butyrica]|uniref:Normocyte-binding protein n=1 Tax=Lucifera butyrica TaxID=1351585 RepID=A0A498RBY6_9FIRM|nr:hypothetical protein [Lucifera butyrica]VBB09024.1 Hypothetical protein LUCI_4310 [Lucifera butyrica]